MIKITVTYDEVEFDKKYAELREYRVTIPPDPILLGFSGLSGLVSQVQGFKDRVSTIYNDSLIMKTRAKIQSDAAKYTYESALDLLIDTDPEIINLPSDRSRVARANKKLKSELTTVRNVEMIFKLYDVYYKVVSNTYSNLESANRNLQEQCNIYKRMNPPQDGQPQYSSPNPNFSSKIKIEAS